MSQQQLGRGPLRTGDDGTPVPARPSETARFVGWLGSLGCAAAGYAVFQFLFGVLPDSLGGTAARYVISGLSGIGTGVAAWLAAALVRARAAAAAGAPASGTTTPVAVVQPAPGPLPRVLSDAYDTLLAAMAVVDDPDRGLLTGWPHALGESAPARPTSVGTAYGLHIMLDFGMPDGRVRTGDLVDTLWRLRLPTGGWSARSQGSEARPEVTALVLGALARAGVPRDRLAQDVDRCTTGFTPRLDLAGRESTHVVTTVMRGLLRAAPDHDVLPLLREALVEGAINDRGRNRLHCWGYRLESPHGLPSALHTAQAVVALDRCARVLDEPEPEEVRTAREDGVRWLLACPATLHHRCPDLRNLREEVRRPRTDDSSRHEILNVRHFTASWLVRALMSPTAQAVVAQDGSAEAWRERLDGAAAAVWAGQTDGVWSWWSADSNELRYPMWMTYQGLSALRAHAVWMYRPGQ
ncbi:hypothetical protein [Streptomyces cylindrosporus]|uniref:Squalene cyclase C-terminal domain-containing protein n=1 Tax=Streptomyces cylindrosporus TaxID=2927583 RepID=A0ABS9Y2S8_9ACTN|nr:hypothetical protein [Streptomyces cylindrosporus]MCI3271513.1 hypothetical protein [Streptomyces cylindrosporus]